MIQKKRTSGSLWTAFKWGLNLGVFNIAIYGKIVWCSFKSSEQYTLKEVCYMILPYFLKMCTFKNVACYCTLSEANWHFPSVTEFI